MPRLNFSILTSERPLRLLAWGIGATWLAMLLITNSHVPAAIRHDPFGLWGDSGPRRIYTDERMSKYLLARRYVPENFDGILMGPSYSANIDPSHIEGTRLYNLSINGGNAYELKHVFEPAASSSRLKYVVLCLHPYIVKESGFKTKGFGSNYLELALLSRQAGHITNAARNGRAIEQPDVYARSEAGWHDFDQVKDLENLDFRARVARMAQVVPGNHSFHVDPRALRDVRDIIALARRNNIRVFAFYFPNDIWSFEATYRSGWDAFRRDMDAIFGPEDVVWDMNTPDYDFIRANPDAYSDGHLNRTGAWLTAKVLQDRLAAHQAGTAPSAR
jgi:hypothetical protein